MDSTSRVCPHAFVGQGFRSRQGFTFTEILVVFVVFGVVTSLTFPRLRESTLRSSVSGAKVDVATYLSVARAAAIRRGKTTQFHASGNAIWVTADSNGTQVTIARKFLLDSNSNVVVTASRDPISYDARGFASGLAGSATWVVTRGGKADSVCITRLGITLLDCQL